MTNKKSIRFYNDHKVRAIWSEEENKWYFSATDIIAAINDEQDYVKSGNYWRWLKKKLASQGIQPVSATHDFKFQAPDGKMRTTDSSAIRELLRGAMTDQINDREIFMKGFDYSYYYDQEDKLT